MNKYDDMYNQLVDISHMMYPIEFVSKIILGSLVLLLLILITIKWHDYVTNQNIIRKKFISDFIYNNNHLEYIDDVLYKFHYEYDKLDDKSKKLVSIEIMWQNLLKNFYKPLNQ